MIPTANTPESVEEPTRVYPRVIPPRPAQGTQPPQFPQAPHQQASPAPYHVPNRQAPSQGFSGTYQQAPYQQVPYHQAPYQPVPVPASPSRALPVVAALAGVALIATGIIGGLLWDASEDTVQPASEQAPPSVAAEEPERSPQVADGTVPLPREVDGYILDTWYGDHEHEWVGEADGSVYFTEYYSLTLDELTEDYVRLDRYDGYVCGEGLFDELSCFIETGNGVLEVYSYNDDEAGIARFARALDTEWAGKAAI